MDCTSTLLKSLYDKTLTAARTKDEAIVTDVIAPFAMKLVSSELSIMPCVTVSADASNH